VKLFETFFRRIIFQSPDWNLVPIIWPDVLTLAILSATVHIYTVDNLLQNSHQFNYGQEVLSYGGVNIVGSFFGCLPQCASDELTQFATDHHAKILTVWLLCAISSFLCASLPYALSLCAFFGICSLAVRLYRPSFVELVNVTGSGVYYAEKHQYGNELNEDPSISIVKFNAPILYANSQLLKKLFKVVADDFEWRTPTKPSSMNPINPNIANPIRTSSCVPSVVFLNEDDVPICDTTINTLSKKVIILDCGAIPEVDCVGAVELKRVYFKFAEKQIRLLFASANVRVRNQLKSTGFYDSVPKEAFFPSVRDAVMAAQQLLGTTNIHMRDQLFSVSMNGYRELITLSGAPSNQELNETRSTITAPRQCMEETRSLLSETSCITRNSPSNFS
ncbi:unnamed protein product, partial [Enterobius vermicularis]|uniref:STAS domain-containing protein n=1 Tax=Enterobius vermicularis TaxID=51028 RepID=A0A0N4VJK8_ENTVE